MCERHSMPTSVDLNLATHVSLVKTLSILALCLFLWVKSPCRPNKFQPGGFWAVSCKLAKEHDHKSQFQGLVKDWECLLLNLWLSFDHFITNPDTRKTCFPTNHNLSMIQELQETLVTLCFNHARCASTTRLSTRWAGRGNCQLTERTASEVLNATNIGVPNNSYVDFNVTNYTF